MLVILEAYARQRFLVSWHIDARIVFRQWRINCVFKPLSFCRYFSVIGEVTFTNYRTPSIELVKFEHWYVLTKMSLHEACSICDKHGCDRWNWTNQPVDGLGSGFAEKRPRCRSVRLIGYTLTGQHAPYHISDSGTQRHWMAWLFDAVDRSDHFWPLTEASLDLSHTSNPITSAKARKFINLFYSIFH